MSQRRRAEGTASRPDPRRAVPSLPQDLTIRIGLLLKERYETELAFRVGASPARLTCRWALHFGPALTRALRENLLRYFSRILLLMALCGCCFF